MPPKSIPENPLSKKRKGKRGFPKRLRILKYSKHMRRWLVNNPWTRPLAIFNYAAIVIQRAFRGHITRFVLKGKSKFPPHLTKYVVNGKLQYPPELPFLKLKATSKSLNSQLDRYLTRLDKYKSIPKPAWMDGGYSGWCASRIQATWRAMLPYRRFKRSKHFVNQIAAIIIQNHARDYLIRKGSLSGANGVVNKGLKKLSVMERKNAAVIKFQLCWRSFCNRRVYVYFRDLIRFKLKGAPYDLMRSIIPNEASLLDRAAGVHVRFRLGGIVFPPKIYFKIYTHRPLCDVNAFAPRNYCEEKSADEIQTLQIHAKHLPNANNFSVPQLRVGTKYFGTKVTTSVDVQNWYKREEKNPWRPIASQALEEKFAPAWLKRSLNSKRPLQPFHFNTQKRKEDRIKAQKAKKRHWMLKAYLLASGKETQELESRDVVVIDAMQHKLTISERNNEKAKFDKDVSSSDSNNKHPKKKVFERVIKFSHAAPEDDKFRGMSDSQSLSSSYNGEDLSSQTSNQTYFLEPRNYHGGGGNIDDNNNEDSIEDALNSEDLVKWSMALNYDNYTRDWVRTATSMPSDVSYKKMYLSSLEHSDDVKAVYSKY